MSSEGIVVKFEDVTRKQLETLTAKRLRELIKEKGLKNRIKGFSTMKKPALINNILKELRKRSKAEKKQAKKAETVATVRTIVAEKARVRKEKELEKQRARSKGMRVEEPPDEPTDVSKAPAPERPAQPAPSTAKRPTKKEMDEVIEVFEVPEPTKVKMLEGEKDTETVLEDFIKRNVEKKETKEERRKRIIEMLSDVDLSDLPMKEKKEVKEKIVETVEKGSPLFKKLLGAGAIVFISELARRITDRIRREEITPEFKRNVDEAIFDALERGEFDINVRPTSRIRAQSAPPRIELNPELKAILASIPRDAPFRTDILFPEE